MKQAVKLGLSALVLISSAAFAVNPMDGLYGGLIIGGSLPATVHPIVYNPITATNIKGTLSYKVFGDIGIDIGYRCAQLRVEGEFFYNNNPFNKFQVGNFVLFNKKTPQGYSIRGQTNVGALMANAFYDFFVAGDSNYIVPYVGAGIGYAKMQNKVTLYQNNVALKEGTASQSATSPAAQGIVGISYFLDDFTAVSLDYRYFTTKTIQPFDARNQINFLNLSFTGALNFLG